jgi:hypothetical protein
MRKIAIILVMAGSMLAITGCKKSDTNPLNDVSNLGSGSYLTFLAKTNTTFDISDLSNSEINVSVKGVGSPIDHINLYVVQGGGNLDTTAWAFIKSIDYTPDSTVVTASAQETADALGITLADFEAGASFTFYNRIYTQDGRQFDIVNIDPAFESNSNYNMALRFTVYIGCPFIAPIGGTYKVLQDDWADWSPGDLVQVEDGPGPNQVNLSHVYPNPAYGDIIDPLIVDVDPANGIATVPETNYGNYSKIAFEPSMTAVGGGFVFSCTGTIDLTLDHFAPSGDYGNLRLLLQKQ